MNRAKLALLLSATTLITVNLSGVAQKATAEQASAIAAQASDNTQPAWANRIIGSYQGEIWHNGKLVPGSTIFQYSDSHQIQGMYITNDRGTYQMGDLSQCKTTSERSISCQFSEPDRSGTFEAKFSPNFSNFQGDERVGSTEMHQWMGAHGQ